MLGYKQKAVLVNKSKSLIQVCLALNGLLSTVPAIGQRPMQINSFGMVTDIPEPFLSRIYSFVSRQLSLSTHMCRRVGFRV